MEVRKPSRDELAAAAQAYFERGLRVAPIARGKKYPNLPKWNSIDWTFERVMEYIDAGTHDGICLVGGRLPDNRIVMYIDFDGEEAIAEARGWVRDCKTGFIQKTPSGGIHLGYFVDVEYKSHTFKDRGIDFRCAASSNKQGAQVLACPSFYAYSDDEAKRKGLPVGHRGIYNLLGDGMPAPANAAIVSRIEALIDPKAKPRKLALPEAKHGVGLASKRRSPRKPRPPLPRGLSDGDETVIAMLEVVLHGWGHKDYSQDWLPMVMAAHAGSGGSSRVREFIAGHTGIDWGDDNDRSTFRSVWNGLRCDGGVTIGTLAKMYIDAGGPKELLRGFHNNVLTSAATSNERAPTRRIEPSYPPKTDWEDDKAKLLNEAIAWNAAHPDAATQTLIERLTDGGIGQ